MSYADYLILAERYRQQFDEAKANRERIWQAYLEATELERRIDASRTAMHATYMAQNTEPAPIVAQEEAA